jgi:elongation factor Ts
MGGKIATLVVLEKEDAELAKGLAMHIAANAPKYVAQEDIPADVIAHEKAIALENMKNDPKMAGKPEAMLNGIADGKVKKLLSESVLGAQVYLLDGENTVANVLKAKGNNVVKFVRYAVGEGIEKRKDDFAAEVMSQIK